MSEVVENKVAHESHKEDPRRDGTGERRSGKVSPSATFCWSILLFDTLIASHKQ